MQTRSFLAIMIVIIMGLCSAQLIFIFYFAISERIKSTKIVASINAYNQSQSSQVNVLQHDHSNDRSTVSDQLKKDVRVLCWVMTNPTNHKKKSRHVKRTWGKRCNILLFMSSAEDDELPTVKLDVGEGRDNLWGKVKEAFKYVYKHHYNDADWFYKADDDTYAVVENMRYLLYPYHPETSVYFGFKFKTHIKQGYMSGGAGYVLSREALRRFVVEGIPNPKMCLSGTTAHEDIELGRCMENLNVTAGDSRDTNGRGRMFIFDPETHLIPYKDRSFWYWRYQFYQSDEGLDCCSDNAVSFHYVSPKLMYVLDYLIYHLNPYGIERAPQRLPNKLKVGEFLPAPIKEPVDPNEDSMYDYDSLYTSTTTVDAIKPNSKEVDLKKNSIEQSKPENSIEFDLKDVDSNVLEKKSIEQSKPEKI